MKLIFATNNRHKLSEVSAILGGASVFAGGSGDAHRESGEGLCGTPDTISDRSSNEVASVVDSKAFELSTPADHGIFDDIPETADTLEGNALQKARYVFERTGADVFADDTGLEVAALDGAPGVRSARYAGDGHNFDDNNKLLLKNLTGVANRSARFRTVIALILRRSDGKPVERLFEGVVEGRIIDGYRGAGGFGYDPVFVPDGQLGDGQKTFAQMDPEQKNAISHRARAVEKLAEFLRGNGPAIVRG